jgi:hypothetical protein
LSVGEVEWLMREGRERLEVKAERGELEEPRPML